MPLPYYIKVSRAPTAPVSITKWVHYNFYVLSLTQVPTNVCEKKFFFIIGNTNFINKSPIRFLIIVLITKLNYICYYIILSSHLGKEKKSYII